MGDFVAQHPRLTRLALHSNGLHALGGAKLLEGVVENARHLEGVLSEESIFQVWKVVEKCDILNVGWLGGGGFHTFFYENFKPGSRSGND